PQGVNVYLHERDGIRLTAARTLSRDPAWRQLSVRRLVTMLHRALEQQMQWAVFEPNTPSLRADIRHLLENFLRRLARANAFAGRRATPRAPQTRRGRATTCRAAATRSATAAFRSVPGSASRWTCRSTSKAGATTG